MWIVSLLKLLAMAVGCVKTSNAAPKPMQPSMKKNHLSIQLFVLEYCSGYCSVGFDKWHWRSDRHGAPRRVVEILCAQWKRCDPLMILLYNVERKFCIAIVTAIMLALRSLIKTEPKTSKLRQVDSHCQALMAGKWINAWMNTNLGSFARKRCERVLSKNVFIADHQPVATARRYQ